MRWIRFCILVFLLCFCIWISFRLNDFRYDVLNVFYLVFGFGLPTMLFQCLSGWSIDFNYEKLLLWLLVVVIIIMERNGCPHIHIFQHRLLFVIKFQCFFFLNILLPMENQAKLRLGMFLLLFVLVCLSLELNRKKKLSAHIEFDSYDDHYVSIIIHTIVKLMHTSF